MHAFSWGFYGYSMIYEKMKLTLKEEKTPKFYSEAQS